MEPKLTDIPNFHHFLWQDNRLVCSVGALSAAEIPWIARFRVHDNTARVGIFPVTTPVAHGGPLFHHRTLGDIPIQRASAPVRLDPDGAFRV